MGTALAAVEGIAATMANVIRVVGNRGIPAALVGFVGATANVTLAAARVVRAESVVRTASAMPTVANPGIRIAITTTMIIRHRRRHMGSGAIRNRIIMTITDQPGSALRGLFIVSEFTQVLTHRSKLSQPQNWHATTPVSPRLEKASWHTSPLYQRYAKK
ncbi:hypothetical protein [Rhizobium sp. Nf11,1]|uniref:hypothetical protein n=1 Tax=Rhizobium sp. Nf11,1 TaxID=3404923 RepID=UPI003D33157A